MEMTGTWNNQTNPKQPYLYNGKEFNDDFGLNLLDFGARWQDPVIGRFLQVDPLAEKYTVWSPYTYTLNNPIRFIDPTGMAPEQVDDVIIKGSQAKQAVAELNAASNLTITRDAKSGKLSATGTANSAADKKLLSAINDSSVRVEVETTNKTSYNSKDGTKNVPLLPGGYEGSKVENVFSMTTLPDGTPQIEFSQVTAKQLVNVNTAAKVAGIIGEQTGETVRHEINEAYIGAKQDPGGNYNSGYQNAHNAAAKLDRVKANLDSPNVDKARRMIQMRKIGSSKWTDVSKY